MSFVSAERLAAGPPPERGKFLRVVPTLVVEILSRPTATRDRTEKKDIYERNGVDEYWLVDPDRREVTVFTFQGGRYDTGRSFASGHVMSPVLPQLAIPLEEIFAL